MMSQYKDMVGHESQYALPITETFETAASIALDNRHILWCKVEKQYGDDDRAVSASPTDVIFYELVVIEDNAGTLHKPSSNAGYDMPGNYHWYKWTAVQGRGDAETIIEQVNIHKINVGYDRHPPTRTVGFKEATIPRLVDIFSKLATSDPELETITDRLVDWLMVTQNVTAKEKGILITAVQDVVIKDLLLSDFSGVGNVTNKLQRVTDTPMGKEMVRWVNFALGGLLIKRATGTYTVEAIRKINGAAITSAIEAYDQAGLITDGFWINFGVCAGGAIICPEFLPILYAKLTSADGPRLLQHCRDAQSITREYITSLLGHYQADSSRDGANVERILRSTRPTGLPQRNIDLTKFVQLSNDLVQRMNLMRHAEIPEEDLLAALKTTDMLSVGDALLRVLYLSRRADLPQGDRVAQFEQDVLHAEIVSLIREGALHRRALLIGHAALTFPDSSVHQIQQLEQMLDSGSSLTEAIDSLRQPGGE